MMTNDNVPPQAPELEKKVIGEILLNENRLIDVVEFLTPEMFYTPANEMIYRAILHLSNLNSPIDILTVTDQLRSTGELSKIQDAAYYITDLTNDSSGIAVEFHGRKLLECFTRRQIIRNSQEQLRNAYDETVDTFDLLESAENSLLNISGKLIKNSGAGIAELVTCEIQELQARINSNKKLVGIPSGFAALDRITNGWQGSNLTIIAARPGMGKTAFALMAARNSNVPTAFFSLEMAASQLTQRLMAAESGVNYSCIQTGNCKSEFETVHNAAGKLSNLKLIIDDSSALSIFELRSKARKLKMKKDIGLIFVDYLQLMRGDREKGGSREQEISSISRGLKSLARELNVPVIALSQLSRNCEARPDKRPILSDLRESGSIEQDADIVGFLYSPSYYKEAFGGQTVPDNVLELNIAKHRNGAITHSPIILQFDKEIAKITSFEKPF